MTAKPDVTRAAWDQVVGLLTGESISLGPVTTDRYLLDPKRLAFFLSRYKFAAKMLRRCRQIVDIGCGDGFGTLTLLAETQASVRGWDFDPPQIEYANKTLVPALLRQRPALAERIRFECVDVLAAGGARPPVDGLVSLDVIEHIAPDREADFFAAYRDSLEPYGIAVIGTPNDYASPYASAHSQIGHINMFKPDRLAETLERYFSRVLMFSMNDELVHTGFDKLSHYIMAVAIK